MNKKINLKLIFIFCSIIIFFYIFTLAYSAINSTMKIIGNAYARVDADIRITDFSLYYVSSNALSEYEEYSKDSISFGTQLSTSDAYVIYKVTVTNYGDEGGIYSISGLPEYLDYELIDYKLNDKLCDASSNCSFGITSDFYIKIKWKNYDTSNLSNNIVLNFEFRNVYSITYQDISGFSVLPSSIMDGEDLRILFSDISNKINIYVDGVEHDRSTYSYNNKSGLLMYSNVSGDLLIEKAESILIEGRLFNQTLKNFVNGIDNAAYGDIDTVVTYIGFYEVEIPEGYTKEEFLNLPSIDVSEDGRTKVYNDNGKLYIYSIDDIYANSGSYSLLRGFSKVTELNILALDTRKVTVAQSFFQDLSSLKYLDISNFDSSNISSFQSMFMGCTSLLELDLSNFSTAKAKTLTRFLEGCESLVSIDFSNFVNTRINDMSALFRNCYNLKYINFGNFDTTNVTIMNHLFYHCESLESIDISKFKTINVTTMERMFGHCYKLKNIYVGDGWDTSNVTAYERMFGDSFELLNFDGRYVDISKAYVGYGGYLTYINSSETDNILNTRGGEICIGNECFYIIGNDYETVSLFAKYNLYAGGDYDYVNGSYIAYGSEATGLQDSTMLGFKNEDNDIRKGVIPFSSSAYWVDGSDYPKYVYDSNSNIYYHIENYKNYLISNNVSIKNARLLNFDELKALGYNSNFDNVPSWVYTSSYWLGTALDDSKLYCITLVPGMSERDYSYSRSYGIRPVIEISIGEARRLLN